MPPATSAARHACHVLVLGAGLAGMRAAWAAKQADPRLDVLLLSPHRAPCGSSFANRNNALGVQAPQPGQEDAFVAEVLGLAPPGLALPELARALATDAPARLDELLGLGLAFRREPDGSPSRFPGCFSPARRALIFDGLAAAHAALLAKLRDLGVRLLHGYEAVDLPRRHGRACGARLAPLRGPLNNGALLDIEAHAVVAALGGPAPLFARSICGPKGSGLSYGLLHRAGARLVNARFLQFFWGRARDQAFVNPGNLPWPDLAPLAEARRGHCPLAYGLPDAALDQALLARRGADGLVRLPGQEPLALFAHAGNGGALIDAQGRTSVPGLFACGECAGGMHGAQRLGGGMVLSALVFGARAGAAAAQSAQGASPAGSPRGPATLRQEARAASDATFLRHLRRGLDRHGLPWARRDAALAAWLADASERAASQRQRLLALSALLVLGEVE